MRKCVVYWAGCDSVGGKIWDCVFWMVWVHRIQKASGPAEAIGRGD